MVQPVPVSISALNPRSREAVASAAHAVQANVVSLRVALAKRAGDAADSLEIRTPAPGAVRRLREILIDRSIVKEYSVPELAMRLRQVWGEFSALCWAFNHADPHNPIDFDEVHEKHPLRCPLHIHEKVREIQLGLWRMVHEQSARHDRSVRDDPQFRAEHDFALANPVKVFGQNIHLCNDADLFACACEHAGMLAALRWAIDDRWEWESPGIMNVTLDMVR